MKYDAILFTRSFLLADWYSYDWFFSWRGAVGKSEVPEFPSWNISLDCSRGIPWIVHLGKPISFNNCRHFIWSYTIFHSGYRDFLLSIKVRVKFSAKQSGTSGLAGVVDDRDATPTKAITTAIATASPDDNNDDDSPMVWISPTAAPRQRPPSRNVQIKSTFYEVTGEIFNIIRSDFSVDTFQKGYVHTESSKPNSCWNPDSWGSTSKPWSRPYYFMQSTEHRWATRQNQGLPIASPPFSSVFPRQVCLPCRFRQDT